MPEVLLSPFSNNHLRTWPHFSALIGLFVERTDLELTILGAASQRVAADMLVRDHPATRVRNTAGSLPWRAVVERMRPAALVVANNSGLAHLAAEVETPAVCVFGGAHNPHRWMPRGGLTTVIIKETACSPCGLLEGCPYGVRCLSEIDPEMVFNICLQRLVQDFGRRPIVRSKDREACS